MFRFDHRVSRPITTKLLDGVDQGLYDKDNMIRDLLNWLSEDEVKQFARANDLLPNAGEPDEDETEGEEG
jgi:hypothetical protein